ncbi:gas vesicle protein [Nocardia yunnanensis]|uniref:Gas vesicle protein n=1 Tax=Nocardia yunnanensis TaxID=2382165 RepID=A0A386ZFC7_9NOCA|nr:gas vesicle protein [Nocardia yunnanensis]AYF75834.1 gas vesicle protein [Nocardia yunnanensis]
MTLPDRYSSRSARSGSEPANLGDILERVLDKGLVIAGDIRVNLLDIELLTIKLRLVIASLETAREVGIDWWQQDPWLHGDAGDKTRDLRGRADPELPTQTDAELRSENERLRQRLAELEAKQPETEHGQ